MKVWQIVLSEFLKLTVSFVAIVFLWLCAGVLFMSCAYADNTVRHIEPNVLTCQEPNGHMFFIFMNDNVVISKHVRKKLLCVNVMDTTGVEHQFCNTGQPELKCRPSFGYQL